MGNPEPGAAEIAATKNSIVYQPMPQRGMTVASLTISDFQFERHSHAEYALGFTARGVQSFNCRGGKFRSTPGDVIMLNPDLVHDGLPGEAGDYEYRMVYVEPDALDDWHDRAAGIRMGRYFGPVVTHDPTAADLLRTALSATNQPQEALRADVLLMRAVMAFFMRHGEQPGECRALASEGGLRMVRIREYIHAHANRDLSLTELADEAGVSRVYLSRAFEKQFGVPPHIYLNAVRIQAAKAFLRCGNSLADTAMRTGFFDQSHFTRRFKGALGVTPGAWLRQIRGK